MDPGVGAPRGGFADLPDRYADLPGQTKPPNLTVPTQTYYCAPRIAHTRVVARGFALGRSRDTVPYHLITVFVSRTPKGKLP
jgi:hypothetical protein